MYALAIVKWNEMKNTTTQLENYKKQADLSRNLVTQYELSEGAARRHPNWSLDNRPTIMMSAHTVKKSYRNESTLTRALADLFSNQSATSARWPARRALEAPPQLDHRSNSRARATDRDEHLEARAHALDTQDWSSLCCVELVARSLAHKFFVSILCK